MMMMQIPRVNEFTSQVTEYNRGLKNDPIQQTSFQTEYDKKVENTKNDEIKATSDNTANNKVESEQSSQNVNDKKEIVNNDVKNSEETNKVEEKTNTDIPEEDKSNTTLTGKEVEVSESMIEKLTNSKDKETKSDEESKKIKNSKKDISKLNKESTSKQTVKSSDEDTLNQSLAAGQNIQTPVENKTELKNGDNKSEDTIVKSDAVKNQSEIGIEKKTALNVSPDKKSTKSESKKEKSEKSESKIKVNDLRADSKKDVVNSENIVKKTSSEVKNVAVVESIDTELSESGLDKTIVLGTTEVTAEGDGGKSQAPVMKEAASLLKQQLKDFGNNEIVKQSRFILKDNNVGEIKLILKPESLGQVKINLNLNENSLAGQIVVENNSVKAIFQENLGQLSKALEDQGFDSAKLDISLSDKEGSEDNSKQKKNKQYFSDRLKRIDESGQVVRYGAPTAGINLTA